jgi:hypothetical protein
MSVQSVDPAEAAKLSRRLLPSGPTMYLHGER